MFNKVPKKYHPEGFELLYEDTDIIVGNKSAGFLTVAAAWNRHRTVQSALNVYIRKGSEHSKKTVYVVHRLDQDTTGLLVFAKTEAALKFFKNNWPSMTKTYLAIVHRTPKEKIGRVSSYLKEDDDYMVHSTEPDVAEAKALVDEESPGQLSHTEYEVLKETPKFSLLKINLETGRKNQIRVHMAELGHPVVGDEKYGPKEVKNRNLMLHSYRLEITHPHSKKRLSFEVKPPRPFQALIEYDY